jgi:hypothetical protein
MMLNLNEWLYYFSSFRNFVIWLLNLRARRRLLIPPWRRCWSYLLNLSGPFGKMERGDAQSDQHCGSIQPTNLIANGTNWSAARKSTKTIRHFQPDWEVAAQSWSTKHFPAGYNSIDSCLASAQDNARFRFGQLGLWNFP